MNESMRTLLREFLFGKLGLMPPQVGSEPYDLVAALHEAGYGQGHRKPAPQAIPDVAPARSEPQLAPRDPRCEAVMHEWEDVSWPEDLLTGPDIEQWRQAFRDGWNLALKYADKPPPTPTVRTSTVATQLAVLKRVEALAHAQENEGYTYYGPHALVEAFETGAGRSGKRGGS